MSACGAPALLPPFFRRVAAAARQNNPPPAFTWLCGAHCSSGAPHCPSALRRRSRVGSPLALSQERRRGGPFPAGCRAARSPAAPQRDCCTADASYRAARLRVPRLLGFLPRRATLPPDLWRRVATAAAALVRRATATARRDGSVPGSCALRWLGRPPWPGGALVSAVMRLSMGRGRHTDTIYIVLSLPLSLARERDTIFAQHRG